MSAKLNLFCKGENEQRSGLKCWGPRRLVEVWRDPGQPLGISIVGGKVGLTNSSASSLDGIFIKNVIDNSPAGR